MKKLLIGALIALPLLAMPARAEGFSWRICMGGNFNFWCRASCSGCCDSCCGPSCGGGGCGGSGCGAQAGPWYQYFPYEAHFQSAAPIAYPYWPVQTLPPQNATAYQYQAPQYPYAVPPQAGQMQQAAYQSPFVQPVGYYYQAPSYWYGR
jgi:hypothetical protein